MLIKGRMPSGGVCEAVWFLSRILSMSFITLCPLSWYVKAGQMVRVVNSNTKWLIYGQDSSGFQQHVAFPAQPLIKSGPMSECCDLEKDFIQSWCQFSYPRCMVHLSCFQTGKSTADIALLYDHHIPTSTRSIMMFFVWLSD